MFNPDELSELKAVMDAMQPMADQVVGLLLKIMDRAANMVNGEIGDRISVSLARIQRRHLDDLVAQGFTREEAMMLIIDTKSRLAQIAQSHGSGKAK